MKTTIEKITPATARKYLQGNVENRVINWAWVKALADALRRGEWKLTHQGIAITGSGRLLDGQHRLLAIVEADLPATMMVTREVDADAYAGMDIGRKRRLGEVLGLPQGMAAVARFLATVEDTQRAAGLTPQYVQPIAEAIADQYQELVAFCPRVTKLWSSAAVRSAAILRILDGEDRDYVHLVYYALNHAEFDAMPPLAQVLMRQSLDGKIRGSAGFDFFARCLRVFDRSCRDQTKLQIKSVESGLQYARGVIAREVRGQASPPRRMSPATMAISPSRARGHAVRLPA